MLYDLFPKEIADLILDYKASIEHHEKFERCLISVRYYWLFRRVCRLYSHYELFIELSQMP